MRTEGSRRRRAPSGSVASSCAVLSVTARLSAGHSVPVTMTKVERSASSSRTRWPGQGRDGRGSAGRMRWWWGLIALVN